MLSAVAANDMSVLEPVNHATPDRAPVWYYGQTHVLADDADVTDLTFWLEGRAEQGLPMAEAAAIEVPADVKPVDVKVIKETYQLGFLLSVPVQRGRTYNFTKYVALSRENWGGATQDTLALARSARQTGFEPLHAALRAACAHALGQMGLANAAFTLESWANVHDRGGFNFLQNTVNLDLSKSISSVATGMNLGMGAEFREERYSIYQGEFGSGGAHDTTRRIYAA